MFVSLTRLADYQNVIIIWFEIVLIGIAVSDISFIFRISCEPFENSCQNWGGCGP